MLLAGSRFSSESAPRPLYGAFVVKEFAKAANLLSFVSFVFDFKDRFFRPTRTSPWWPRGQGWPLHQPCGMLRLFLNGFEGDGTLTRSG
jgi:hypothetical protein